MKHKSKKELREELNRIEYEYKDLIGRYDRLCQKIYEINKAQDNLPSSCKPGRLCQACIHRKFIAVQTGRYEYETVTVCGLYECCEGFIQDETFGKGEK